jgi:hypothetical protein
MQTTLMNHPTGNECTPTCEEVGVLESWTYWNVHNIIFFESYCKILLGHDLLKGVING